MYDSEGAGGVADTTWKLPVKDLRRLAWAALRTATLRPPSAAASSTSTTAVRLVSLLTVGSER